MGNQGAISKQPSQQRLRIAKLAPNVVNDGIVQFGGCQIHRCLGVTLRLIASRRDVVAVAPILPCRGFKAGKRPPVMPEQATCQWKIQQITIFGRHTGAACALRHDLMNLIPKRQIDDRRVLATMPVTLVIDLADQHPVIQQPVYGIAVEGLATALLAVACHPMLGLVAALLQEVDQFAHGAEIQKAPKNVPHHARFSIDH